MRTLCLALIACMTTACAPVNEQARQARADEREYRQVDWELRYRDYERRCRNAGGHMLLQRVGRIERLPRPGERFSCTRGIGPTPRD